MGDRISDEEIRDLVREIQAKKNEVVGKSNGSTGLISAGELETQKYRYLPTGIPSLDKWLGGGIRSSALTEFFGRYGTGKTQLCLQLSVNATLPKELNGWESHVIYIDTEGTFEARRVRQIAEYRYNISGKDVLRKILVARPKILREYLNTILSLDKYLNEINDVGLIVVDSFISIFRNELAGTLYDLKQRQDLIIATASLLKRIAEAYDIPVVITNQLMAVPRSAPGLPGDVATGGHVLAHTSTYRLEIVAPSIRKTLRIIRMVDSSHHPPFEIRVRITDKGVEDAE